MIPDSVSLLTAEVKHSYRRSGLSYAAMDKMGDRIRLLREAKGWSQEELAKELTMRGCKVSRVAVSYWESGASKNIKNRTMLALVDALGTTQQYLLFGPDKRNPGHSGGHNGGDNAVSAGKTRR